MPEDRVRYQPLMGPVGDGGAADELHPVRDAVKGAWNGLSDDQRSRIRTQLAKVRARWAERHPGREFPGRGAHRR